MAVARQQESVLASLSELKAIEEERVADELAAVRAAELARVAAREAEERAKLEAEAAKRREEHEAALAIETARLNAEREARMKIEATEAQERARQQAILAETRLAQEMELRRAEVAKKRPTWMLVVTGIATIAAFVLIYVAIDSTRKSEQARTEAALAEQEVREMKRQLGDLKTSLEQMENEGAVLAAKTDQLHKQLKDANTAAEREAVAAEIAKNREKERKLAIAREEARIKKEKIERGKKIEVDKECLTQSVSKNCMK
jgi:hypothetical protein